MSIIAVIIGRAGSKGLKHKNMRILAGKPLTAWTIEHAQASHKPQAVILTSDGPDILDIGKTYGIHTYQRPAELAGDTVTIDAAVRHGVSSWEQETGKRATYIAILYANVALRAENLTDRALTKLIDTQCDSVQTVYNVGKTHPLWMRKLEGPDTDIVEPYIPNEIYRRQDLPPVYMLNSGVLAVTRDKLFDVDPNHPHNFLGKDRRAIITKPTDVVDIDDELDLIFAQAVLEHRKNQG
ncbi:MAG: acylneuraminate cytidylyltransferase family protein [Phycisphaeraceae bacterium]|nr:acylneuraminate cytidylyltransferase family protein [Phycisphaeraceae bacterium]